MEWKKRARNAVLAALAVAMIPVVIAVVSSVSEEAAAVVILVGLCVGVVIFVRSLWRLLRSAGKFQNEQARIKEIATRPISAELLNTETVGPGRTVSAAAGGFLAGTAGVLAGAMLGKPKLMATFKVEYANFTTGIESVEVNSKRYRQLMAVAKK